MTGFSKYKESRKSFSNLDGWILLAIVICGFALYISPLQSKDFCWDDHNSIENNAAIKAIDLPKIFNAFNTRFLPGLSFALNYKWGALNPAGYRLVNLLIHCFNAFLVYLLFKSILHFSARKPLFYRLEWPAFFASIIFLCHPIQTESVNFITQRFVLMGTFFYLLTIILYIEYRCSSKKRYLVASMASAMAAMFCKEFVVTLPIMLVLYDFYFLGSLRETLWDRCRSLTPFFFIALIVPILLLRTPSGAIEAANIASSNSAHHIDITRAHGSISRQQYFLTELHVLCTYIRLLFIPINQNLDYDYPISYQMDHKTIFCGIFLFFLLAVACVTYKTHRVISFSILWFFIALSVESSFIPIGDLMTEYRLYLASIGFVFLMMSIIYMMRPNVKMLNMIAVAILIGFSVLTYQRNKVWKDEVTLMNDTVKKSPHKARVYSYLGVAYLAQGNFVQALFNCNKAIEINPKFTTGYNNCGLIYAQQGNFIQAMLDFNKAIELNSEFADAYNNRGIVFSKQGNFTQAMLDFNKAIELNPDFIVAYNNRNSLLQISKHVKL